MTAAVSFLVAFLLATSDSTQESQVQTTIRGAYEQAKREHRLGNYATAASAFGEIYRQTGDPAMLFNRGQSLRLDGKVAEALEAYRGYLRDRPDAPNRALVETKIRELNDEAKRPVTATPMVTKRTKTELELFDPILDDAFKPTPATGAANQVPVAAMPAPTTTATQELSATTPIWKRWWIWTAVGVAVAGGTAAVVMSNRNSGPPSTPLGNQGIF